uniref:Mitochondrial assembly of ribosomal large subunit protein 1 n=1 Tax=Callorhinchus milii TaxID=7868 RepID=A0A4W3JAV5_CALMI
AVCEDSSGVEGGGRGIELSVIRIHVEVDPMSMDDVTKRDTALDGVGGETVSGDSVNFEKYLEFSLNLKTSVFTIDYLVALLRQENAKDICVIKVPEEIKYTDYFIIVSGTSARHLHAMAHYALKVYKQLKTEQLPQVNMEGKDTEDWKCIDFGNIVIHFMLPETREVYELEKLWTLRSHDDQLAKIPQEMFPSDFIYEPTDVDDSATECFDLKCAKC